MRCQQSLWRALRERGPRTTIQCPPSALATQYLLQEGRCACCGTELEWLARGEGLGLCLEDREALGLWEVDDTRLPVLVSKETAQADQAEAEGGAGCPNAAPERDFSTSPYWFWCSQCARAQGLLVPNQITDLARTNAGLAQRVRACTRTSCA